LKHAAYPLRRDEGIVRAAVAENAAAFRYCLPSPIKDHLLCDRQFVLELAKTAPKTLVYAASTEKGHGIIKFDRQILLEAIGKGLEWSNIPESLQENKDFVQLALEQNPKLYMDLSEEMRETFEIAFKVVAMSEEQEMDDVILEATERCPILLSNRYAMTAIVKNWRADVLQETLQFSPLEIRSDKDIMIEAVKNDSIAFYGPNNSISAQKPLAYSTLQEIVANFIPYDTLNAEKSENASSCTMVVALILPHCYMAETAVMLVTLLSQHSKSSGISVAPIDPNMPRSRMIATLEHLQCTALITSSSIYDQIQDDTLVQNLSDIRLVEPDKECNVIGVVKYTYVKQGPLQPASFVFDSLPPA